MIGKLGRIESKHDARDLRLASYLAARPTAPPFARNWTTAPNGKPIKFSMLANDAHSCCTCAALGHVEQAASVHTGVASNISDALVLEAYDSISDWSIKKPTENDDGASCRDALKWFKAKGIIESYVRLDAASRLHLEIACNAFGAAYVGADLPIAAQRQAVWDVAPKDGWNDDYKRRSWGGHAMALLGYDRDGVWFATWGKVQRATWAWVISYVDEAWGAIADKWTAPERLTPSGFDIARLTADAAKVAT